MFACVQNKVVQSSTCCSGDEESSALASSSLSLKDFGIACSCGCPVRLPPMLNLELVCLCPSMQGLYLQVRFLMYVHIKGGNLAVLAENCNGSRHLTQFRVNLKICAKNYTIQYAELTTPTGTVPDLNMMLYTKSSTK